MRGDIILVGDEHRAAATAIVDHLIDDIRASNLRFTITVAGESGERRVEVVIAEGVDTSLCDHVDRRAFIARNRLETMEHRMQRAREEFDPFIEEVLVTEHDIISQHRELADVVISKEYDVEHVER